MKIQTKIITAIMFLCYLNLSCNREGVELLIDRYPIKYKFEKTEINQTKFYRYEKNNSFEPFNPVSEDIIKADSTLYEFIEIGEEYWSNMEIELISDYLAKITVDDDDPTNPFNPLNPLRRETFGIDRISNTEFIIELPHGQIHFEQPNFDLIKSCIRTSTYRYYSQTYQEIRFSSISSEICTDENEIEILRNIIRENSGINFNLDDIFLLNESSYNLISVE